MTCKKCGSEHVAIQAVSETKRREKMKKINVTTAYDTNEKVICSAVLGGVSRDLA